MSNPAVIVLSETIATRGESFRIEDNIGEAIHLHYGALRLDFTVQGFLEFSEMVKDAVGNLIAVDGFDVDQYDPIFLSSLGEGLSHLESVQVDQLRLSELEVYTDSWLGPRLRPLPESRMLAALQGNTDSYVRFRQHNLYGQSNLDRLSNILEEVRREGYPHRERYIVLFNDQNIIRDGQHRAAVLYFLQGDQQIKVLRMQFRNRRFAVSRHPWLAALPGRLSRMPVKMLSHSYRRCRRAGGNVLRSLGLR